MISRIAILGTGLLGTSVGLALREAGFKGAITGWNRSPEQGQVALKMGAIDSLAADAIEAARASQVTLLAVPIYATLDFMEKLRRLLGPEQLLTDVGSTKRLITETAARLYNTPERAAFLPGHPDGGQRTRRRVSGRCQSVSRRGVAFYGRSRGRAHAASGRSWSKEWREWVEKMGSKTLDLDAVRHDELVAWVSHLPQFTATALSALLEEEVGGAPELKDVGGRALREMTRLGASPFSMWRDIAHTNTEAVERAIAALEQRLAYLRENLRTPELRNEFEQANKFRRE